MTARRLAYLLYLETPEWQRQRRRALERADYCCEQCGACEHLEAHHLSYDNLGCEQPDDLIVLCDPCHRDAHAPRNRALRVREQHGQQRLFERWAPPLPAKRAA